MTSYRVDICLVHGRSDKDMFELEKRGSGLTTHAIAYGLLNWHGDSACALRLIGGECFVGEKACLVQ